MVRRKRVVAFFCVLLVAGMMIPCLGVAQEAGKAKGGTGSEKGYDDWHFLFYTPGWLPALNGDVTARGVKAPVDVSYWDQVEDLKFADMLALGHFEVQKGPWGGWIEGIYGKFSDEVDFAKTVKLPIVVPIELQFRGQIKVTAVTSFDEAALSYDVYRSGSSIGNRAVLTLQAYGGARYMYFMTKVEGTLSGPFGGRSRTFKGTRDWVDPIVGGRVLWNLSDRWMAAFRTDVGGFGASSKFTLNLDGFLVYRANKWLRVWGGYRALYEDHQEGSGKDKFKYNLWTHAPWLGMGVEF
jgi:hypothetical protein